MYGKARQRPTHLLLAAVDLPFLLIRQSEHGLPVLIRQVQFILQQEQRLLCSFLHHCTHITQMIKKNTFWIMTGKNKTICIPSLRTQSLLFSCPYIVIRPSKTFQQRLQITRWVEFAQCHLIVQPSHCLAENGSPQSTEECFNIHPAALLNSSVWYKEPPAPFEMHMRPGNESLCARDEMQSLGKEGEINQGRREMEEGDRKRGVGAMWFWKWPSTKK